MCLAPLEKSKGGQRSVSEGRLTGREVKEVTELESHDLTYILKVKSVCCVENRKNGVKVEAGRHLEGHYSNLKDDNSLNQAGFRKRGEKCLDSVYVLE